MSTPAPTALPRDDWGAPIQVLPHRAGGGWVSPTGAASISIGPFSAGTRVVTMRAVGAAVFWQPGTSATVVAVPAATVAGSGPHFLNDGECVDIVLVSTQDGAAPADHIAVIAASGAGSVFISERG